MRNRIITFIFIIPFLLILLLFGVSKALGNKFDVPVRGIEILNDAKLKENRILDIDKKDSFDLFVNVKPSNAKNKKIHVDVVNESDKNRVSYELSDINGGKRIKFKGSGKVTIKCKTDEGGYTTQMTLRIVHSKIYDITPKVYTKTAFDNNKDADINIVDNTVNLETSNKKYNFIGEINPSTLNHLGVEWESNNEHILEIDKYSGEAVTHFSGETTVTARVGNVVKNVLVKVNKPNETKINGDTLTVQSTSANKIYIENATVSQIENATVVESISSTQHIIEYTNNFKVKGTEYKINKNNSQTYIASNMQYGDKIYQKKNTTMRYHLKSDTDISDVEYEIDGTTFKGDTVDISVDKNDKTIKAKYKLNGEIQATESTIVAIENISTIYNEHEGKGYGNDKIRTIGNKDYDKDNSEIQSKIKSKFYTLDEHYDEISDGIKDIEYVKSGDFATDGYEIAPVELGIQRLTAKWKYARFFPIEESRYEFNVIDGVNVRNKTDLIKASESERQAAIQNDIFIEGEDYTKNEMYTTYNWKYYKNIGEQRPKIQYLYEFKNNVYGNGFQINADKITTNPKTSFKSSPSLVEAKRKQLGLELKAAVKGQDNICFLVRKDNITLSNIILKACRDESLIEKDKINQKRLEDKGTVLEIMGNNVELLNSRVSNGKTCVRIFGKDLHSDDPEFNPLVQADEDFNPTLNEQKMSTVDVPREKINVRISGCVISTAREFLIKIGSNRAVLGKGKGASDVEPYQFKKADGTRYEYNKKEEYDEYFKNNYVLTRVELENNELRNSGLFCIGMDAHFAGKLMWTKQEGPAAIVENDWKQMAATSYPSELNIKGYMKMYNWVNLKDLSSDSLIETSGNLKGLDFLKLDFKSMIENVVEKRHLKNLLHNNKYVNAGIAFFGGGMNYAFLNEDSEEIKNYTTKLFVNLSEAKGKDHLTNAIAKEMPVAAGIADFMFYIYKTDNANGERGYHWQHK